MKMCLQMNAVKSLYGLACAVLVATTASAQQFITDDFMRTTDGALSNPWSQPAGNPFVTNDGVAQTIEAGTLVAWNTDLQTLSGSGDEFTAKLDVRVNAGRVIGLAFNVQDADNFYYVALQTTVNRYSFGKVVAGTPTATLFNDASLIFNNNTWYSITVTSSTPGIFGFTITEQGESTALNPTTTFTDLGSIFEGGHAGLFKTGDVATYQFDNFSLAVIPEPATVAATIGLVAFIPALLYRRRRLK